MVIDGVIDVSSTLKRGNAMDNLIMLYYSGKDRQSITTNRIMFELNKEQSKIYIDHAFPYLKNKNSVDNSVGYDSMHKKLNAILKKEGK